MRGNGVGEIIAGISNAQFVFGRSGKLKLFAQVSGKLKLFAQVSSPKIVLPGFIFVVIFVPRSNKPFNVSSVGRSTCYTRPRCMRT